MSSGVRRTVGALTAAIVCSLLVVQAASALSAYTEPAFTKGTSNTWYWSYSYPSDGISREVCVTEYVNGVSQGPYNDGCTNPLTGSGTLHVSHSRLVSGDSYDECAAEFSNAGLGGGYAPDGVDPCMATTMDNAAPQAHTGVDGAAHYTNTPVMHLEVFYASAVAWPWQGGSTFDCWRKGNPNPGTPCQNAPTSAPDQLQFDPGCSSPAGNESANSDWTCDYDTSKLRGYGDGNWYYCAVEADAAIPDHPGTPDQLTGATSSGANLSADAAANCGSVTLDTTPPSVEASASTSTVTAGQSVRFAATASDSGSGVDGTYSWNFGDGGTGSGGSPSHTFSSPGTYTVRASTADGVGNAGSATTTVTVTTASSSGHGGGNGTHGNGTSGNGTSGNGNSGNGNSGKGQPTKNTGSTKQTGRSSPPSCTVPRLSGRSLSSARTLLRRAHCATGAVREPRRAPKARPRRGRRWELVVAAQSARSGRRLRHGSKIGLTLRYREETK